MDEITFHNRKIDFKKLTGKDADDNLAAFFSYLIMLNQSDIKAQLEHIKSNLKTLSR